jgi:signal transduction histidine kinase
MSSLRKKLGPKYQGIEMRITISIIMLTLLSFLLARHITDPITKLRKATQEFATGNLVPI